MNLCSVVCLSDSLICVSKTHYQDTKLKMVLKLTIEDEKRKRKVLKVVAAVEGVDSVIVEMKENKITIIGNADPVCVTGRLRKFGFGYAELLSVGPAKEEKKDEKKVEKKEEKKPETPKVVYAYPPGNRYSYFSMENPNIWTTS
ncbi:hypothetical protein SUGI_0123720 [Cryptomeria japonica]|uniref:heavy metal-associated isoprenylated plant protein 39 n=1 Tax=Cryptomeria japonica TaxID=3369 RepID=UPI002408DF05|nr:heavy metal-associated isoprenylated plant protein 39 [Cryptomeria japonica]GLJ10190.1 hypothetical protein SUGI_0123720 [Cryptomeria japonica]